MDGGRGRLNACPAANLLELREEMRLRAAGAVGDDEALRPTLGELFEEDLAKLR